jgi:hypothetical protein
MRAAGDSAVDAARMAGWPFAGSCKRGAAGPHPSVQRDPAETVCRAPTMSMSSASALACAALGAVLAVGSCFAAEAGHDADRSDGRAAAMDFSGIDRFWEIQSTLAAGDEPTPDAWDALFATPGYALLQERERRRDALSEAFRIAYRPGHEPRSGEGARGEEWIAYVLPHLRRVPQLRRELESFRGTIEQERFLLAAVKRAQTRLPAGTTARFPPPPISFVFFAPDGRGYPRLILDLLHLMHGGDRSQHFLAHELFHAYRNRIARVPVRAFGDDLLIWALANAEDEGVADQLDKADIPALDAGAMRARFPDAETRAYYASYQAEYRRSRHWVQFAERQLEAYARDPAMHADIGGRLHGELPDNGRVLGAFMAATIDAELGRRALLAVVGDPIAFWRAYDRAASSSDGRAAPLSDAAMQALDALERRYYGR